MSEERVLFEHEAIGRTLRRLALEIVDATRGTERLALVGIRRGGVPLAGRLAALIAETEGKSVPVGTLEIALYRDDAATAPPDPKIGPSHIDFPVSGRDVVLVDDVLQTGRTVRAAIDGLLDYGRPRRIWLAVLFDRGGRELPVAADFVGRAVELAPGEKLLVELEGESDRAIVRSKS
ncbi:MAG: bifunctional pyr operon transcriptional regulator/uracil phosphoribosyltransferase PyrR [Sandaracinaceae bacterium]|nr:bifunctional pyr operon transcriptional regulator/uracil phosphoribosyltransferase PyrR [Sandaracinaceae bacterium]